VAVPPKAPPALVAAPPVATLPPVAEAPPFGPGLPDSSSPLQAAAPAALSTANVVALRLRLIFMSRLPDSGFTKALRDAL
jgi:hypothetical protein